MRSGLVEADVEEERVVERNLELQTAFMEYVLSHPDLLDRLPDDFRLAFLPDDDPELSRYNLELLRTQGDAEKPLVIVRMSTRPAADFRRYRPQVFVPLAA